MRLLLYNNIEPYLRRLGEKGEQDIDFLVLCGFDCNKKIKNESDNTVYTPFSSAILEVIVSESIHKVISEKKRRVAYALIGNGADPALAFQKETYSSSPLFNTSMGRDFQSKLFERRAVYLQRKRYKQHLEKEKVVWVGCLKDQDSPFYSLSPEMTQHILDKAFGQEQMQWRQYMRDVDEQIELSKSEKLD